MGKCRIQVRKLSDSSLHCWKDRNGKKCLQCSAVMHKKGILSDMLGGTLKRSFIFCSFFLYSLFLYSLSG